MSSFFRLSCLSVTTAPGLCDQEAAAKQPPLDALCPHYAIPLLQLALRVPLTSRLPGTSSNQQLPVGINYMLTYLGENPLAVPVSTGSVHRRLPGIACRGAAVLSAQKGVSGSAGRVLTVVPGGRPSAWLPAGLSPVLPLHCFLRLPLLLQMGTC
jgi:hypothetical protein